MNRELLFGRQGMTYVGLLLAITLIGIATTALTPMWSTMVRRDKKPNCSSVSGSTAGPSLYIDRTTAATRPSWKTCWRTRRSFKSGATSAESTVTR